MDDIRVSVVIPTYLGAEYLRGAIDSVMAQTYQNFEIVVIDDASPDATAEVIAGYSDPRLRYIVNETNQGAGVTRNRAATEARGEILAFLDQDDYFHPEKLALHVKHFAADPELGASYSGRFELNSGTTDIREIWEVPHCVTLADLVLGFPISPTDLAVRREWFLRPDIRAVYDVFHGGEIIRYGRLYLAGCKFAPVGRALSYHRYHTGRVYRDIERNCGHYLFSQNMIFDDERCPEAIRALRPRAHTMSYVVWANYALNQNETELAQKLLRQAAALTPTLTEGSYCPLVQALLGADLESDYADHEAMLRNAYRQLPADVCFDAAQLENAIAQGYWMRAIRCLIWGRDELAASYFGRAMQLRISVTEANIGYLTHQLLNYEIAFGAGPTGDVIQRLAPYLRSGGTKRTTDQLVARLAANRAWRKFQAQDYRHVPKECVQAITHDPRLLTNRGMLSVFVRSLTRLNESGTAR